VTIAGRRVVFLLGGWEGVIAASIAKEAEQELISVGALQVFIMLAIVFLTGLQNHDVKLRVAY
jgi:hypothetical protein